MFGIFYTEIILL